MSYASVADYLLRFDAQQTGDLVSDNGIPVPLSELSTDVVLLQMLTDASGEIEVALLAGQRYTLANLQPSDAVTNPTGLSGNSLAWIKRVCCELAHVMLLRRRGMFDPERHQAQAEAAEKDLERLRRGETVFGLAPQIDAGVATYTGVGTVDFSTLHLPMDRQRRYFPRRPIQDGK